MPRPERDPKSPPPAAVATMYMSPGKMIMTRGNPDGHEQVYLLCGIRGDNDNDNDNENKTGNVNNKNELGGGGSNSLRKAHQQRDVAAQKAALAEFFAGCGYTARLPQILQGLRDSEDFYLERLGIVKCESWSSVIPSDNGSAEGESPGGGSGRSTTPGRVVLVGDAGYCPSSKTGMGTTTAMVGAWILAGEIGTATATTTTSSAEDDVIDGALHEYEAKLRPYVDQVQRGLPETPGFFERSLETRAGIAFLYFAMALASLLKIDLISNFVTREDIKGWELPVY